MLYNDCDLKFQMFSRAEQAYHYAPCFPTRRPGCRLTATGSSSAPTDEVYDVMRRSILTNVFRPGQRLPIEEIANQLGVSLTPVRHAIQQLATEGLIEIRPRSARLSPASMCRILPRPSTFVVPWNASLPKVQYAT